MNTSERQFRRLSILPPMFILVVLAVVPFALMLGVSLTDFSFSIPGRDGAFVGTENYQRLAHDKRLHESFFATIQFVCLAVPIEFTLGFLLAFTVNSLRRGKAFVTVLIVLPSILAPVTVGLTWRLLLHGDYGPIGYYATKFQLTGTSSILGSPTSAFWALILIDVWQWTPFMAMVILAGLRSIPRERYQAAAIDGASPFQIFVGQTIPALRTAMAVALLFRFMDAFKEFDKVFVLTHGGPASSTEFLSIYTWISAFEHGDLGYASAVTLAAFIVVLFVCNLFLWGLKDDVA